MTFGEYQLYDNAIFDNLKNRAFLMPEGSKYINIEKTLKPGRYEVFEASVQAGATVARLVEGKPFEWDVSKVQSQLEEIRMDVQGEPAEISFYGPTKVMLSECIHKIITPAEVVYNLEDTSMVMKLLQLKPQVWTLFIVAVFAGIMGFLIAKAM